MIVTLYHNVRDNLGVPVEATIREFQELLVEAAQQPLPPSRKLDHTLFSTACYHPDTPTRAKAHAIHAEAIALDVDEGWTVEAADRVLDHLDTPYVLYTTTKCRADDHRFRIVLFLSRPVDAAEYEQLWLSLARYFKVTMDTKTRDISRLSVMPAEWEGAHFDFRYWRFGDLIDPDAMMRAFPPPLEPEPTPEPASAPAFFDPMRQARRNLRRARNATVDPAILSDLDTSPIVPARSLQEAMSARPGGRTFKLLCAVAASAERQGYEVGERELTDIADAFSRRVGRRATKHETRNDIRNVLAWARTL